MWPSIVWQMWKWWMLIISILSYVCYILYLLFKDLGTWCIVDDRDAFVDHAWLCRIICIVDGTGCPNFFALSSYYYLLYLKALPFSRIPWAK
jgi:hypothetical protein